MPDLSKYRISANCSGTTCPIWNNTARYRGSYKFDASDDYFDLGNPSYLQLTKNLSIEAWVNPTANTGTYFRIASKMSDVTYNGYELLLHTDNGKAFLQLGTGGTLSSAYSDSAIPLAKWTHIIATYDGSTMRMYVGEALQASQLQLNAMVLLNKFNIEWAGGASAFIVTWTDYTIILFLQMK